MTQRLLARPTIYPRPPVRSLLPALLAAALALAVPARSGLGSNPFSKLRTTAAAIKSKLTAQPTTIPGDAEWLLESVDVSGINLIWKDGHPGGVASARTRTLAIAVPPGSTASASFLEGSSGGNLAVSAPARFRDVSISALTFTPAVTAIARTVSARIRVVFRVGNLPAWRPAFAPSEASPGERQLSGWVANYAQSRGFRSTPAAALSKSAADGPSPGAYLSARRLVIKTKGDSIEVVTYDALRLAGLPLSDIDPRRMRLYFDGREVPMFVSGEQDGRWDAEDYIEFIGKRPSGLTSYNSFYANRAVFLLTWDGGRLGLRAPAVPVASRTGGLVPSFPADAKAALPFQTRVHIEEDVDVLRIGSTSAEEIIDLGSRVQETELTDFWVWKRVGAEKDQTEVPFSLGYSPADLGNGKKGGSVGTLRITLNLKGITNNPNAAPDHHLKFLLNGRDISLTEAVNHDAIWEGQESYTWVSPPLDPGVLKAGKNSLVIQKVNDLKTSDGQLVEVQDAYLNFMELEFPAAYKAVNDMLAFSNSFADSSGLKLFTLENFVSNDLSLWDKQGRKLTNFRVTRNGGAWEASFLDTLSGRTDYLICAADKREVPEIQLDTLDNLLDTKQGADYIVITQRELKGRALDSLTAFRAKQGLRTRVVMARHIYQAFGDGSMDPIAIRRFVAYAYANWARPAPAYLALVGDASLGFEKLGTTIVPFHPVNIRGWGVAANDDYFAKVSGDDDIADLNVGRIPAATPQQLSQIVHKTLLAETARPQGHWSNKALLISGFESAFTNQNYVLQGIAVGNDRQYSRVDLFPGSPYYKTAAQRANFYDQIDSGFNLVSFVGHGGGAVWSDAGVLTLKALDEGKITGDYPISLVSSVTCLTGFFEDIHAPSLGEEMLRLPAGGAAGFYGAAGYISNLAGEALSSEVIRAATSNGFTSNGAIITQAETMVKLRTGDVFLPILAEFNLLGDPAFGLPYPAREGNLVLDPDVLNKSSSLTVKASKLPIETGDAAVTVFLGDSIQGEENGKLSGGSLEVKHAFAGTSPSTQNGKVIVHYWDEKRARVASAPFSGLDWLIDSVAIDPPGAAPGDSVHITARINTAYAKTVFRNGVTFWEVGGETAKQFPQNNVIGLVSADNIHLVSVVKIPLEVPEADLANPHVHIGFRLNIGILDVQGDTVDALSLGSRTYSLPLKELPRLELPARAMHLPIQDELGLWVLFHNRGFGTAKDFRVSLMRDAEASLPILDTLAYARSLGLGGLDSLFFPLNDSMLAGKRLRATLIPSREGELAEAGRSQDTVFHVSTRKLGSSADTLALDTSGHFVTVSGTPAKPGRAFAQPVSVPSLPPHLTPAEGALPITAFRIEAGDFGAAGFTLGIVDSDGVLPKRAAAAAGRAAWHYRTLAGQTWIKLDTIAAPADSRVAAGFRSGLYALLVNKDVTAPIIQLSSRGQALLNDDYVPLHTPIDVVMRDGEGVDLALHPPLLASHQQTLDTTNNSIEANDLFPTLARINFIPVKRSDHDSITITASDISGNKSTRTLAYRMGDKLKIRDLGSYPNPFADTATFVYSLTDYCDQVDLKIYSRAGRLVRDLEQRNVVGYQEVVWDGRTNGNHEVANGLYFLKITAKIGSNETSRTYKLFKKKRK